ncbi:MAG: HAD family hydrolase, partial [Eubacteriales bacterium]
KEGIPLMPGAMELIDYARERGYKIAVASSSSQEHSIRVLTEANIYHLLDASIFGNMVKHSKPDPEIYIGACQLLGLKPDECMALEDSPAGIDSAAAAGLVTIMIPDLVTPQAETLEKVDYHYKNLLEVIDLLEKIK